MSVGGAERDYGVVLTGSLDDLTLAVDAGGDRAAAGVAPNRVTDPAGYRVGIDVGGTFTDLICVTPDGAVLLDKTPTTPDDQSVGVMTGIAPARAARTGCRPPTSARRIDALVHGTTTADNTMIEMNGARHRAPRHRAATATRSRCAGCTRRRSGTRRTPRPRRSPAAGRASRSPSASTSRATSSCPSTRTRCASGVQRLRQLGCTSIAVLFMHSFTNPAHELRARELVLEEFPDVEHISLSHEVMPRAPEFERTSTTLVNAYVAPADRRLHAPPHRRAARRRLRGADADHAVDRRRHAARLRRAQGGRRCSARARPAASWARRSPPGAAASRDFVAVDMGGTSYDVCLVRGGAPEIKTDWNWRYRYYIGLPMVDVQSVGAGGGSIASVRQGALLVGPESAGAQPGPACYGRGGTRATVTDADALLGYLPVEGFAGGRMTPRRRGVARRHRPRRRRAARARRDRGGVGHRAHRQRQHGQRRAPRALHPRRRPAHAGDDRLRRQRRGARVGAGGRARDPAHPRAQVRAGVLRARPARRRLPHRPAARLRRPAVTGRRGARAHADERDARRGRQGARAGQPRRGPRADRSCSRRCATRARTST